MLRRSSRSPCSAEGVFRVFKLGKYSESLMLITEGLKRSYPGGGSDGWMFIQFLMTFQLRKKMEFSMNFNDFALSSLLRSTSARALTMGATGRGMATKGNVEKWPLHKLQCAGKK